MRLRVLFVFWSFLCASTLMGQSSRAYRRAGDAAFNNKDYGAAIRYYSDLLKRKPDNSSLQWQYAECSRLMYSCKEAENTFEQLIESDTVIYKKFPLVYFRLAEVQKMQGDYAAAAANFDLFTRTASAGTDSVFLLRAAMEANLCRNIRELDSNRLPAAVKHPGKEINSTWYDFAPAIAGDTLYYSSVRFERKAQGNRKKPVRISRVMIAVGPGRGREPGRGFPVTDTAHVAHSAFTPDGRYMFFTLCRDINASEKRCELWVTALDRRNKWLSPKKIACQRQLARIYRHTPQCRLRQQQTITGTAVCERQTRWQGQTGHLECTPRHQLFLSVQYSCSGQAIIQSSIVQPASE